MLISVEIKLTHKINDLVIVLMHLHAHIHTTRQRSQLSNTFSARVMMSESRLSPNQTTAGLRRPLQPAWSHLKHTHTQTHSVKTNKLMWKERSIKTEYVSPGQLQNRDVSVFSVWVWSSDKTIWLKISDYTKKVDYTHINIKFKMHSS